MVETPYISASGMEGQKLPFGSWQNIRGINILLVIPTEFDEKGAPKPNLDSPYMEIDNLIVEVVPLPAALWFFASALGLLGWRHQRSNHSPAVAGSSGKK